MIRQNFVNAKRGIGTVAVLALVLIPVVVGRTQDTGAAKSDIRINSNLAIRQVVARFSDGWNRKARDGSDWPYRAGYVNFLMERLGNRWVIVVSHAADFNAQAPEPAK
jgi:hypothetical protein